MCKPLEDRDTFTGEEVEVTEDGAGGVSHVADVAHFVPRIGLDWIYFLPYFFPNNEASK